MIKSMTGFASVSHEDESGVIGVTVRAVNHRYLDVQLRLPAALPYFLTGLRISGGLALVGAVVAEFVAGSGGFASGLAYRILEAGYRLQIPRMFAALVLLSLAGVAINLGLEWFGRLILRARGGA